MVRHAGGGDDVGVPNYFAQDRNGTAHRALGKREPALEHPNYGRRILRKRFYILFVARGDDGQLRKIPIPVHYLYVFLVGGVIGFLSLTGIASSYLRMLLKVSQFNQLKTEKDELKTRYSRLEQVAKERDIQVASLGSLASEVSTLYGLKADPTLVTASTGNLQDAQVTSSLDQLYALRTSALSGATMTGISLGLTRNSTTADWVRANSAPNLWPVEGQITGAFGERIDPFNGEGAFHSGVDISAVVGQPVLGDANLGIPLLAARRPRTLLDPHGRDAQRGKILHRDRNLAMLTV